MSAHIAEKLKNEMMHLEFSLFKPEASLGVFRKKLTEQRERILFFYNLLSEYEKEDVEDHYINCFFDYLACICYFGEGNKNSLRYLVRSRFN